MSAHFVSLQNCHIALYFGIKHVERSKNARYKFNSNVYFFRRKNSHRVQLKLCISEAGSSLLKSSCTIQ